MLRSGDPAAPGAEHHPDAGGGEGALGPVRRGDQRKLKQVLLNLLSNAVKYTKEGEVVTRARYGSGLFSCEVADSGIGIAKEELDTVFEPFTQLLDRGQFGEGTGLGLAITKRLVTLMQGKIEVESEPGKGSVFRIEIPLPLVAQEEAIGEAACGRCEESAPVAQVPEEPVQAPPPEQLQELHQLAVLGNMQQILAWADALQEREPDYGRFAGMLRELAGRFKAKALLALVEQYMRKDHERSP